MKFTRGKRIALELLGPPALGAGIFALYLIGAAAWEIAVKGKALGKTLGDFGLGILIVLVYAYIFVGVQSILYAVIMEWRFKRGLDPRSWRAVMLSTALGFASGSIIAVPLGVEEGRWFLAALASLSVSSWGC